MAYKILVVEDNEFNQDMLKKWLIRKGFIVVIAENGKIGVDLAKEEVPNLILMDIDMPVLNGWEATKIIKTTEELAKIPIIILSAHARHDEKVRSFEMGCDAFEPKPVDFQSLQRKIDDLLKDFPEIKNVE